MASLIGLCSLSTQETHPLTLHLSCVPYKHTTALPIRFLLKLAGCSAWRRALAVNLTGIRPSVILWLGVERGSPQAERGSVLL